MTTMIAPRDAPHGVAPSAAADEQRETLLDLFGEAQRRLMARPDTSSTGEWLRLNLSTSQLKLLLWLCASGAQPMGQIAPTPGGGMPSATPLVDPLVGARLAQPGPGTGPPPGGI